MVRPVGDHRGPDSLVGPRDQQPTGFVQGPGPDFEAVPVQSQLLCLDEVNAVLDEVGCTFRGIKLKVHDFLLDKKYTDTRIV